MKRSLMMAAGGLTLAGLVLGIGGGRAQAHPLGNLTVNTAARIVVDADVVTVDYVLDLAELPTVQERPSIDAAGSPDVYAATKCSALMAGVAVHLDGAARPLTVDGSSAVLLPGQGGLSTLRVECHLVGAGEVGSATLGWSDANFTDRLGWREVVALGDGMTLSTDLPSVSPSDILRSYPTGALAPRVLEASVGVRSGGPRLDPAVVGGADSSTSTVPQRRGADGLTRFFNRLVGDRDLTLGLGLLAAGVAFLLGALHSLAPGHGKTLMAAMVASRRGTMRQVLAVGGTVALTHTLGVLVLGVLITTSQVVAPDRVLPWLTLASGALLLGTGAWLLGRRLVRGASAGGHHHGAFAHDGHGHDHGGHGHGQAHHDHPHHDHPHHDDGHAAHDHGHAAQNHGHAAHDHGHAAHDHGHAHADHGHGHAHDDRPLSGKSLALMGVAGGLVPTPSALVVLLGATALGRAWFGVVLVGIYGIGMAATLLAAGMLLVKVQGWLERQYAQARWLALSVRLLPVATAVLLILGGLSIAVRGAASI